MFTPHPVGLPRQSSHTTSMVHAEWLFMPCGCKSGACVVWMNAVNYQTFGVRMSYDVHLDCDVFQRQPLARTLPLMVNCTYHKRTAQILAYNGLSSVRLVIVLLAIARNNRVEHYTYQYVERKGGGGKVSRSSSTKVASDLHLRAQVEKKYHLVRSPCWHFEI